MIIDLRPGAKLQSEVFEMLKDISYKKIDSFNNQTELQIGDNRIIKTTFSLKLQGYLVPNSINKELTQQPPKFFSKSSVVFNGELEVEASGAPITREERRATSQNIVQQQTGVGYGTVEQNSNIVG